MSCVDLQGPAARLVLFLFPGQPTRLVKVCPKCPAVVDAGRGSVEPHQVETDMVEHLAVHAPVHPRNGRELGEDTAGATLFPSFNHRLIHFLGQTGCGKA